MPNPTFLALEAFDGTVVMVSLVLVFAMLIALCLIIMLQGRFFDRAAPKAAKPAPAPVPKPAASKAAPAAPAAKAPAAPAPAAEGAVPGEVVAAIAAAVATVMGEGAVIRGIRRMPAPGRSRRGAWGDAAARELTTPFV